ncbi:MAG: putative photosynthetic complex assembly protein PuhE [Hyphomicrobiaceae bacterium]|nr:putative photosynthetic complex assembly protein PuhE [Hyphomicrobiaceae bacterium]
MADAILPVLFAIAVWWSSTGALFLVDRLPRSTYVVSVSVATLLVLVATTAILVTANETTAASAYIGFSAAVMLWAWHEMTFLLGLITGPRKSPCPPAATGFQRFGFATATLITHEIAIAVTAVALVALTWGAANQTAAATFLVLWVMRLSAKFNIFLGVPNLSDELMPAHLGYLKTYFRKRAMNALFPFSVTVGTIAAYAIGSAALDDPTNAFALTSGMLVSGLLALAVLEHWFLVLPVPDAALWTWAGPRVETATNHPAGGTEGAANHSLRPRDHDIVKKHTGAAFVPALMGGNQ